MIISQYFKGRNFMTPDVIEYGELAPQDGGRMFYELSEGTGFLSDEKLFGLTVVSVKNGQVTKLDNLSQAFNNLVDVQLTLKGYGVKAIQPVA